MTRPVELLDAVLVAREDVTPRLARFRLRPATTSIRPFEPGQFVQIGLPMESSAAAPLPDRPARMRMHKRPYSIASAPAELPEVELYLALVDGGRFTPLLWSLPTGSRLWIDTEPKGVFTFARVPPGADLVLVATGTGLAPYLSLLRSQPSRGPWRRIVVVHGVRRPAELGYRAELEARAARDATVRYVPVVSRPTPSDGWNGLVGRVQSALSGDALASHGVELDPARTHVFLCGNPEMIRDVRGLLEPRGYRLDSAEAPGSLHFEKYW